jgi:hypothetical protein
MLLLLLYKFTDHAMLIHSHETKELAPGVLLFVKLFTRRELYKTRLFSLRHASAHATRCLKPTGRSADATLYRPASKLARQPAVFKRAPSGRIDGAVYAASSSSSVKLVELPSRSLDCWSLKPRDVNSATQRRGGQRVGL